jgi:hypothetical protein
MKEQNTRILRAPRDIVSTKTAKYSYYALRAQNFPFAALLLPQNSL